jgi:hypothetical protein
MVVGTEEKERRKAERSKNEVCTIYTGYYKTITNKIMRSITCLPVS